MRVLVYGINYYPESIGIGKYTTEMCEWLAGRGHIVHVITAMPHYPQWHIVSPYKKRWWHIEDVKHVKVFRSPMYVSSHVTTKSRLLLEISFALSSMIWWISALFRKYDSLICIAPPFQTALPGVIYKFFHRRTIFVNHIQDLQLDVAVQLGLIQNKFLVSFLTRLEKALLSNADFISTISDGMERNLVSKAIAREKIIDLKNWIDTVNICPKSINHDIKEAFGIHPSKKVILYSGNIGEKQGLEILIPIAESMKATDVHFLIIGEGSFKSRLTKMIADSDLANITLFPLQPYERLVDILNMAHLHLVLQKRAAADLVMPSKLTAILAVGGVAIVTTEQGTALHDVITKNEMAIIVEPENLEALKSAIIDNLNKDLSPYKINGRKYAVDNLEKEQIMTRFETFLTAKR